MVIIDSNRIRNSHPSESKLGTVFEGGDVIEAFSQHEYISKTAASRLFHTSITTY
ncbi:hypothetical protein M5W82_11910 [Lysinibacillus xylanilyticus]|uniref:Uncharacterized protein n=1 Tax=Lysinibacillus xylanilyticus TaxID=582475 RepID=A0ABT4EPR0_9BACI|nr:hypothetical protein [Lysinibacillus xylanilyticus]MED3800663.1 hypothetical protein [Lysinibacillus xylanilyticus]